MSAQRFKIVLVTAPNLKAARKLAGKALRARLTACANVIPKLESHYWWKEKIERSSELLIIFKTTSKHLKALEKLVIAEHPYDTPEFIVLSIENGNRRYLEWIQSSCLG